MPWFGQEIFTMADAKGPLSDTAYIKARDDARRLAGPEGIDAALAAQQLDALLAPATGPAWAVDWVNGDHFLGAGYGAAAVAGRSEEHTSELQSLMRSSSAVFWLKKKRKHTDREQLRTQRTWQRSAVHVSIDSHKRAHE